MKSNDISFLDLDERSRSHQKVKGHRRGGVCVLWMLLVIFFFFVTLSWPDFHQSRRCNHWCLRIHRYSDESTTGVLVSWCSSIAELEPGHSERPRSLRNYLCALGKLKLWVYQSASLCWCCWRITLSSENSLQWLTCISCHYTVCHCHCMVFFCLCVFSFIFNYRLNSVSYHSQLGTAVAQKLI